MKKGILGLILMVLIVGGVACASEKPVGPTLGPETTPTPVSTTPRPTTEEPGLTPSPSPTPNQPTPSGKVIKLPLWKIPGAIDEEAFETEFKGKTIQTAGVIKKIETEQDKIIITLYYPPYELRGREFVSPKPLLAKEGEHLVIRVEAEKVAPGKFVFKIISSVPPIKTTTADLVEDAVSLFLSSGIKAVEEKYRQVVVEVTGEIAGKKTDSLFNETEYYLSGGTLPGIRVVFKDDQLKGVPPEKLWKGKTITVRGILNVWFFSMEKVLPTRFTMPGEVKLDVPIFLD